MAKKSSNKQANVARFDEQQRQDKIRAGTQRIDNIFNTGSDGTNAVADAPAGGFGDQFFQGRRKAYTDYATPQLEDQYGKAQRELTFSLARAGTLDSSMRAEKEAELKKLYDQRTREVGDQALQYETTARNDVESARADLIRTLSATGDAQGAATSAINRAGALSAAPAYSPLGQLFTEFTGALGTQAAQERAASLSGGSYKPPYNTGLFGVKNAVKTT